MWNLFSYKDIKSRFNFVLLSLFSIYIQPEACGENFTDYNGDWIGDLPIGVPGEDLH